MLTSIEGRSVIVTGASKGIGKGIARVFAGRGARVLLAARNLSQAEAAVTSFPFPEIRYYLWQLVIAFAFELSRERRTPFRF